MNSLYMRNNGQWTEARFNSFIKSALRKASQRWPVRFDVLNTAKRGKRLNKKSGRLAEHYICNACKGLFPAKEVNVDHILPIIDPSVGFKTWDLVVERMFCESDGL